MKVKDRTTEHQLISELVEVRQQVAELEISEAEHKQREEELREHLERLGTMLERRTKELQDAHGKLIRQEKLVVLGQLAGGVGQELRNPLGAIKNAACFLNMVLKEPEQEVKKTLQILEKEVAASQRIVNSLLEFARPRPPVWRKVDINHVIQEALSRAVLPPNIQVVRQLDEALPPILADPYQFIQVFDNLILNAIQAMPEGGQLLVKSEMQSPEWVCASIADTGEGIAEENIGEIFEPLFSTRAGGIGLGLTTVRTIVEGYGGTIEVASEQVQGSTFRVNLHRDGVRAR